MLGRPKFVLASGSPRRLSLLNQAGIEPDALRPADVDETPLAKQTGRELADTQESFAIFLRRTLEWIHTEPISNLNGRKAIVT